MNVRIDTTPIAAPPESPVTLLRGRESSSLAPDLASAFLAVGAAEPRLAQLLSGDALCVTTGQQPALFTGPLYAVYKALSAAAYAQWCEQLAGRPVVPVFWVAGDDHDFAEANHVHLLTAENAVETLVLRDRPPDAPQLPLYREPLGSDVEHALAAALATLPQTEFAPDVTAWLQRFWEPTRDIASAFAESMADLLGPHGVVVYRSTARAAKRAAAPYLVRALEEAERLDAALGAGAAALEDAGAAAPVGVGDGATLVMLEASQGRDRLVLDGSERFRTRRSDEKLSLDDLRTIASLEPERLSANVLLRPVVEAALLPTVAYVGGPGELAYLPQCEPIYAILGVRRQMPVPRWSGRVVEAKIAKVLQKYDIVPEDLGGPEGHLEGSLAREAMPTEAAEAIAGLRRALGTEFARLEQAAVEIDPTMKKTVQHTRNVALGGVSDLEKKLIAHLKKQNAIVQQQLAKASANLLPHGRPQERVFSVAHYLVRYGRAFLDDVYAECLRWVNAGGEQAGSGD